MGHPNQWLGKIPGLVMVFMLLAGAAYAGARQPEKQLQQVETLVEQGRLGEAESEVRAELQRRPSVDGYNLLGIIKSDQQDYSSAIAAFKEALKLSPHAAKTHNNLGNVYGGGAGLRTRPRRRCLPGAAGGYLRASGGHGARGRDF